MDRPRALGLRASPSLVAPSMRSLTNQVSGTASSWRLMTRIAPEIEAAERTGLARQAYKPRPIRHAWPYLMACIVIGHAESNEPGSRHSAQLAVGDPDRTGSSKGITGRAQVCTWTPSAYRRPHLHNHQTPHRGGPLAQGYFVGGLLSCSAWGSKPRPVI
jgi:hypothetical protein